MSIDKVRERITELSAEMDRVVESSPELKRLGFPWPADSARDHVVAQARVELAVYVGAMKSVGTLFQRAIESGDHALAMQASAVMSAMEESLALARATVDELLREDS